MINRFRISSRTRHNATRVTIAGGLMALAITSLIRGSFVQSTQASGSGLARHLISAINGVRQVPAEYATIQLAIDASIPGDTVVVDAGEWSERIDYQGKPLTVRSRDGAAATSIIGDGSAGPIVTIDGVGALGAKLEGFTVTGGRSSSGAGLLLEGTESEITSCVFTGNEGSGVVVRGGRPTFFSCALSHNASAWGAGLRVEDGTPSLIDCSIEGNTAVTFGGGVYARGGQTVMVRGSIRNNRTTSGAFGGGIYSEGGIINLFDSAITGNSSEEMGGAAYLAGGEAGFHGCRFSGNVAASAFSLAGDGLVAFSDSVMYGTPEDHLGNGMAAAGLAFDLQSESDCDHDGISDSSEIAAGLAEDCDGNGVPDECDADCNGNGIVDRCEIRAGLAADCNGNSVPDRCEIDWGLERDADFDGRIDGCAQR
ncbi:MAG: hypothetical protein EXS00_05525 [Phycisphaerales bacterium]|nr:hypothetical protein [Phycisphaerales bacterium]